MDTNTFQDAVPAGYLQIQHFLLIRAKSVCEALKKKKGVVGLKERSFALTQEHGAGNEDGIYHVICHIHFVGSMGDDMLVLVVAYDFSPYQNKCSLFHASSV